VVTKEKSGRGRPRKFDVDKAITQAMDLFQRNGYDGVGVAELSQAMGIAAPSLYSAFGSKRELFKRVLQHYAQMQGCWLQDALSEGDSLEQSISLLFLRAAEVYSADPQRLGCLAIDGTRNCSDVEACELTAQMTRAAREMVRNRITAAAPNLAASEVDALADYVAMILVGLSGSARDGVGVKTLRASAEIAAEGFIQRLRR
jgi:TetR/AcrR family transcriptional regulator, repressor for divergent bdcA